MRKIIFIILLFLNCLDTERGNCDKTIRAKGQSNRDCIFLLKFIPGTKNLEAEFSQKSGKPNDNSLTDGVTAYVALTCLVAIQKEKECSKKSKYIPAIDSRSD